MKRQSRIIATILLVLFVCVVIVVALTIKRKHDSSVRLRTSNDLALDGSSALVDKSQNTAGADTSGAATQDNLQASQEDVSRKNDASRLLAGVAEFQANNQGTLPSSWQDGALVSADGTMSVPVSLSFYKSVTMIKGAANALSNDVLQLGLGAVCQSDGSITAGTARQVTAQYHTSLGPKCIDL